MMFPEVRRVHLAFSVVAISAAMCIFFLSRWTLEACPEFLPSEPCVVSPLEPAPPPPVQRVLSTDALSRCCNSSSKPINQTLPTYIFFAGIEGSGHHALMSLITSLKVTKINYRPQAHMMGKLKRSAIPDGQQDDSEDVLLLSPNARALLEVDRGILPPELDADDALEAEQHGARATRQNSDATRRTGADIDYAEWRKQFAEWMPLAPGKVTVDVADSFPMGFPRSVGRHPDVKFLVDADGDLYNLFVVVLLRDPTACVVSALRRRFTDSIPFQTRIFEHNLIYLQSTVPFIPCDRVIYLRYETLSVDSTLRPLAYKLAEWTRVDAERFYRSARGMVHMSETEIPPEYHAAQQLFQSRVSMWPLMEYCPGFCASPAEFCPFA